MAKYDISIPDYINDLTLDQLENLVRKATIKLEQVNSEPRVNILVVSDGSVNTDFFHAKDIDKAVAKLIEYTTRPEFAKHGWKREAWRIIETRVLPWELKDVGLERLDANGE